MKMGRAGPALEPRRRPRACMSGDSRSQNADSHLSHMLHLWTLCELVDRDEQELNAPGSMGEGAQDVEPPD